jgi:hypothetical protein
MGVEGEVGEERVAVLSALDVHPGVRELGQRVLGVPLVVCAPRLVQSLMVCRAQGEQIGDVLVAEVVVGAVVELVARRAADGARVGRAWVSVVGVAQLTPPR